MVSLLSVAAMPMLTLRLCASTKHVLSLSKGSGKALPFDPAQDELRPSAIGLKEQSSLKGAHY